MGRGCEERRKGRAGSGIRDARSDSAKSKNRAAEGTRDKFEMERPPTWKEREKNEMEGRIGVYYGRLMAGGGKTWFENSQMRMFRGEEDITWM